MKKTQVLDWLYRTAAFMEENKTYLTKLDTAIGDADHGNNMHRGFSNVIEQLPKYEEKDIGSICKAVAMVLISKVGGASGPLYGTMFMQAANTVNGKEELSGDDLKKFLKAGLEGIIMRGKASVGDKTMVDAYTPALAAFSDSIENGDDISSALDKAVAASEEGMKSTIPLIAKKGRASYLGERSKDHQDPGATSLTLMLTAMRDASKA